VTNHSAARLAGELFVRANARSKVGATTTAHLAWILATDPTNPEALRGYTFPVYLAYGLLTEEFMVRRVRFLAGLPPDVSIEAYPGIHHFVPPQRSQPAKYAAALRQLWARAEGRGTESATGGDSGYAA
jgi:hypothetical protein